MNICIICEGCYPYIVGGVSSWIQQLIEKCPEYNFIVYAIVSDRKMKDNYKYKIPSNVKYIEEIFLDDMYNITTKNRYKKYRNKKINKDGLESIKNLIMNKDVDAIKLIKFFQDTSLDLNEILMGEDFYNYAVDIYKENYSSTQFTKYLWTLRSMYLTLFYILKSLPPEADIYHTVSTGYAGILGVMGKVIYNKPLLVTEHGIYTREREEEIIKANWISSEFKNLWIDYFYTMCKIAYKHLDKGITLFERSRKIQVSLGCIDEKTKVIPNGIDVNKFDDAPFKEDEDYINIGAVLRVTPIKDVKTMIYAFNIIKKNYKKSRLYIMGPTDEDEDYYLECVDLVNILKIEDVIFTDRIVVKDYIKKMDIILLTSISEGQPLSILEAFAAEVPCITTNVGCCNELIYGVNDGIGPAGAVVPIMAYESVAMETLKLCRDKELRKSYGKNGRIRAEKYYTEEKFIHDYKKLYNELGSIGD